MIDLFYNQRMLVVFLLGFSSGLPSEVTRTALQAWFTVAGVNVVKIGLLSFIGLPYAYKFLWAPLLDRYQPNFFGRRTSWIFIFQILLILMIAVLGLFNPVANYLWLIILAFFIAFISASQDIVIDAYRTELLNPNERGPGTALNVGGYRIAMIFSGGISLIIAQWFGWRDTYLLLALCMLFGVIATYIAPEPDYQAPIPRTLQAAIVQPFLQFLQRPKAWWILIFIIIYKISYAFILMMTPTFLLRALHFSLIDVGTVNKGVGMLATIIGVFWGGIVCSKIGNYRALLIFAILQASANLLFVLLALVGKNYWLMASTIFIVNLFAGMEAAVFVALLMSLCDKRYTATHYALFSALAVVGNVLITPISGVIVNDFGWVNFYWLTALIAIPSLILLLFLKQSFINAEQTDNG